MNSFTFKTDLSIKDYGDNINDPLFQLDPRIESASAAALQQVAPRFTEIDEVTEYNQLKVLRAFMDNGISERHFGSSTGYGYGDEGRETDKVWAQVFGAEDALVRHNFTCGTHTLAVALFGVLRQGTKCCASAVCPMTPCTA